MFMIDSNGNVYYPEDEQKIIGNYDVKQKKWRYGGPQDVKVELEKAEEADIAKLRAKKPVAPKIEEPAEEFAEVEECEIDGKEYLKDEEGIVYDVLTEDPVGKYDFAKKCWISK